MELKYSNTVPDFEKSYEPHNEPIDNEYPPSNVESRATMPYLPRDFNKESYDMGQWVHTAFLAKINSEITGAISTQTILKSKHYYWRTVKVNPKFAEMSVYGVTGDINTLTTRYHQGFSQGYNTSIAIPRGLREKDMLGYVKLFRSQLLHSIDCLERAAQLGVFLRMLNNKDSLKEWIRESTQPLQMNAENFLETYYNIFSNIYRIKNGHLKIGIEADKLLDIFYADRKKMGNANSWIFIIIPEMWEHVVFEKDSNNLFLWSGFNSSTKPEKFSMYVYNTADIYGDAIYVNKNFPMRNNLLGTQLLCKNTEKGRNFIFPPFNMIKNGTKDLDEDDIYIRNDNDRNDNEHRISYREAIMAIKPDNILKIFKNPPNIYKFIENCIGTTSDFAKNSNLAINEGTVRSTDDYFKFIVSTTGLKKAIENAKKMLSNYLNNYDISKSQYSNKLEYFGMTKEWVELKDIISNIADFLISLGININQDNKNAIQALLIYDLIKNKHLINGLSSNALWNTDQSVDSLVKFLKARTSLASFDNTYTGLNFERPHLFIISMLKRVVADDDSIKIFINQLMKLNIELPFGIRLDKRSFFYDGTTFKVRKHCMSQPISKTYVSKAINYPDGGEHYTMFVDMAEILPDDRDILRLEGTFPIKCVRGGGIKIWEEKEDIVYQADESYKFGDLYPVPITLVEVFNRPDMIDIVGYDRIIDYKDVITDIRDRNDTNKRPYYSTCEEVSSYYKWKHSTTVIRRSAPYFDKTIMEENTVSWIGYQRNQYDNSIIYEKGYYRAHNGRWWAEEMPVVTINNLKK